MPPERCMSECTLKGTLIPNVFTLGICWLTRLNYLPFKVNMNSLENAWYTIQMCTHSSRNMGSVFPKLNSYNSSLCTVLWWKCTHVKNVFWFSKISKIIFPHYSRMCTTKDQNCLNLEHYQSIPTTSLWFYRLK